MRENDLVPSNEVHRYDLEKEDLVEEKVRRKKKRKKEKKKREKIKNVESHVRIANSNHRAYWIIYHTMSVFFVALEQSPSYVRVDA